MPNNPRQLTYQLLRRNGHSPAKALEIMIDAERHDTVALAWIEMLKEKEERQRNV